MQDRLTGRAETIARYVLRTDCTVREAARHFGLSKSTVHTDLHIRLREANRMLYDEVQERMEKHFSIKHLRGGESTRIAFGKKKAVAQLTRGGGIDQVGDGSV